MKQYLKTYNKIKSLSSEEPTNEDVERCIMEANRCDLCHYREKISKCK